MTITEFLIERIADDHSTANGIELAAHLVPPNMSGLYWGNGPYAEVHITKERLLAECEAKRRIIEIVAWSESEYYEADAAGPGDRRVLQVLALPYSDHPDYNEAWRP